MGLSNQADRLDEYVARVRQGDADRIAPGDVDQIVGKLERKRARLQERLRSATSSAERERCERKIAKADDLIERATALRARL